MAYVCRILGSLERGDTNFEVSPYMVIDKTNPITTCPTRVCHAAQLRKVVAESGFNGSVRTSPFPSFCSV